jgi:hypothetical protein
MNQVVQALRCCTPILVTCLVALFAIPVLAQAPYRRGDVNDDGCVNNADVALLIANIGPNPLPGTCWAAFDIDNNGIVSLADFAEMLDFVIYEQQECQPDASFLGCSSYVSCNTECPTECNLPDNGNGTVDVPPNDCIYLTPNEFHMVVDGLPPGTELKVGAVHHSFTNITRTPGGVFGPDGETETFDSLLRLKIQGTGTLASYERVLSVNAPVEIHVEEQLPGQSFETDMRTLEAEITGDPDFDLLRIRAGSDYAGPSPGLTRLVETNSFDLVSNFNVSYEIEMVGAAAGPLAGVSGTTTGTVSMGIPLGARPVPAIGPIGIGVAVLGFVIARLGLHARRRRLPA